MIRELRHFWDVLAGHIPLATPLLCTRPSCTRTRGQVNGVEAQILTSHRRIRCRCGYPMRPAPDTGHHIAKAAACNGDGEQP